MTSNGWDPRAFRRECAIPPEQLARLNALPGWAGFMQVRDASDESPSRSPPDRPAAAHPPTSEGCQDLKASRAPSRSNLA
jgi:hypothetical protein